MNAPASGWHPDPTARHEHRYWDGSRWTDDVSDRGVAEHRSHAGGTRQRPDRGHRRHAVYPQSYPTQMGAGPGGPPPQAPGPGGFGPYGGLPPTGPGSYGSGGMPPAVPEKQGPKTGLLVGLGLLAIAAVAVVVVLLTGGDDDEDTASDPLSDIELPEDTGSGDEPTDSGDSGDTDSTDAPDDLGDLSEMDPSEVPTEMITDLVVDQLVASGAYTEEQAICVTESLFDELSVEELAEIGESGDPMSSITPEQLSGMSEAMLECMG